MVVNNYDFGGWATVVNKRCSDGRTIMKDAFIDNDGAQVPLVWNHQHTEANNVLGHALLENRPEGVYAYCTFNESESGKMGRELVKHGDVNQLSIYANQLKQQGGNVIHGVIREVSLVLAGANPGAYIDTIMCHSDDSDEAGIIFTGEDIVLAHSEDETVEEEETLAHASNNKDGEGAGKEESKMADPKEEKKEEVKAEEPKKEPENEKTVKDVLDTFNEEQKKVFYFLLSQVAEDAGASDDEGNAEKDNKSENIKHSEGGNDTMYTNVFNREAEEPANVLTHADQEEILKMAKAPGMTLKSAIEAFADDHKDTLAHGFETSEVGKLFPDYKDVYPGAPELLERDHDWVDQVLSKARKSPVSRVRTKQIDARAAAIRAKGYSKRDKEKTISANLKVLMRTTDPQTIYFRDALHRDDVVDITDFDVVAYQRNVMKRNLEEEVALAALIGDGRQDTDQDKISEDHIRPVWKDADLYTIKASVDIDGMKTKLQGTDTSANFGEEYIQTEAIIAASLHAREKYKAKGTPDFYCTPHLLNTMLLARDLNGRRIYDSAADLAKVLRVNNIYTVEQMEGLSREADPAKTEETGKKFNLLGIFVNMANYQFGSTKGGEITSFEDFDIDFNQYKYLMETRLSGALTDVYAAIALEQPVAVTAGEP
jgi:hypothetical protein